MFKYMYIHWHCISIPLGMKAYDYCGSPFMAVRAAQKFYPQFSNTQLSCSDGTKLHLGNVFCFYQKCTELMPCFLSHPFRKQPYRIAHVLNCTGFLVSSGLLGPLSTVSVAEMASDIPASQVSPRILHPDLSDKSMHPYFLRTGRNWFSLARVNTTYWMPV